MEDINRIELCGTVGSVRLNNCPGMQVANFSLLTQYGYVNPEGYVICENTWHTVVYTQNAEWLQGCVPDITEIQPGVRIRLVGRTRNTRYTSADGSEKMLVEVVTQSFSIVDNK